MNIKDFRYVIAVVDCGSYSRAAEALYISQPSLSAYIHNLEKQLNIQFFEPNSRVLTPEGELYVDYARSIAALDDELMEKLEQLHRSKDKHMRFGMTNGRSEQFLGVIYDSVEQNGSSITVDINIDTSKNLIRKAASGELDVILVNHSMEMPTLRTELIYKDQFLLALHKDRITDSMAYTIPGDKYRHLSPLVLYDLPFVVFPEGRSIRSAFDHFFADAAKKPSIIQEVSSVRSGCRLVNRNHAAMLLFDIPTEISFLSSECECFLVDSPLMKIDYVMAWAGTHKFSREQKSLIRQIAESIRENR